MCASASFYIGRIFEDMVKHIAHDGPGWCHCRWVVKKWNLILFDLNLNLRFDNFNKHHFDFFCSVVRVWVIALNQSQLTVHTTLQRNWLNCCTSVKSMYCKMKKRWSWIQSNCWKSVAFRLTMAFCHQKMVSLDLVKKTQLYIQRKNNSNNNIKFGFTTCVLLHILGQMGPTNFPMNGEKATYTPSKRARSQSLYVF